VLLVDTGVLVALADRRDSHHRACVHWLLSAGRPLVVPPMVLAEACYLVQRHLGTDAEAAMIDSIGPGRRFDLGDLVAEDLGRIAELVRRYSGLRLGGTDASVIAAAERLGITDIATVDRRHFTVVRPAHVDAFTLWPTL
jgi:hypothetical protein